MPDYPTLGDPGFRAAFLDNERQERVNTGKVASALVVILMPVGIVLDLWVYPKYWRFFVVLRLVCSVLAGVLWFLYTTPFGEKHHRVLGLPIALLPAFFIAWMIYYSGDSNSVYYAGLTLILLAVNVVFRGKVLESLLAVGGVLLMYGAVCLLRPGYGPGILNNFYFLVLTGIIVVTGNYVFNRLRFREFKASYELERNRKALEESHRKLLELDQVKSRFFANISHELRTPLTLLLAPLEALLHRFPLDVETRDLLQTMHANGMRLLKLINDLLDWSVSNPAPRD